MRTVVTAPVGRPKPPAEWGKPPGREPSAPVAIGDCPVCGGRVTDLSGSPTDVPRIRLIRAHLYRAVPCDCWILPEEADELGRK